MLNKIRSIIFGNNYTEKEKKEKVKNDYYSYYEKFVNETIIRFEEKMELSDIPELYKCLFIKDMEKYKKIIKYITDFLTKIEVEKLIYLDKIFRDRTSLEWNGDWKEINPNIFLNESMNEKEKILFLGISSFHPNGFYREKSLIELQKYSSGIELPFFIIRTNDWVEKIRVNARKIILEKIENKNITSIIDSFAVFYKICEWQRNDNRDIIEKLEAIFTDESNNSYLKNGLKNESSKIRKLCYKNLLKNKIRIEEIIEYIIKEKEPFLRYFVYKNILSNYEKNEIEQYQKYIANDKYYKIRIEWISYISKNNPQKYLATFKEKVLDENFEIRKIARQVISNYEKIDFKEFYMSKLSINAYSAIMGITDIGNEKDSLLLEKYLEDDREKIIKVTLKALASLNYEKYIEIFIKYLQHNNFGISNCCKKIIGLKISEYSTEKLYEIYIKNPTEHIQLNCVKLLMRTEKWKAIRFILEFINNENEEIGKLAILHYFAWKASFNKSFITPSKEELKRIVEKIDNVKRLENEEKEWVKYIIK